MMPGTEMVVLINYLNDIKLYIYILPTLLQQAALGIWKESLTQK